MFRDDVNSRMKVIPSEETARQMTQISIKDIAKRADVSIATVSRVLNNKGNVKPATLKRVREAMDFYHYEPNQNARALVGGTTQTIGLFYPAGNAGNYSLLFSEGYTLELLRGVTDQLNETGYSLYLINDPGTGSAGSKAGFLKYVEQNRVDGLIFLHVNGDKAFQAGLDSLRSAGFPFTYAGERINSGDINVYAHYTEYMRNILLQLLEAGHRRILYTGMSSDIRLSGILKELKRRYSDMEIIFEDHAAFMSDSMLKASIEKNILKNRITASFSDLYINTVRILYSFASLGLAVPEDISVAGVVHSQEQLALTANISSALVPSREMGRELARLLLERIKDPDSAPRQADFHPVFYDRGSISSVKV